MSRRARDAGASPRPSESPHGAVAALRYALITGLAITVTWLGASGGGNAASRAEPASSEADLCLHSPAY